MAIFLMVVLAACSSSSGKQKPGAVNKLTARQLPVKGQLPGKRSAPTDTLTPDQQADAFANYYVVVADTGIDYYFLREEMIALKNSAGMTIDTMGRYYNLKKQLIALPDDDPDEIYAGDYFPRRYPGINLSLEYLHSYKRDAKEKMIALVAGICENKTSADSVLKTISSQNGAFAFKAKVYVGCMH